MKIKALLLLCLSPMALFAEEPSTPKSSGYVPKTKSSFNPEGLHNGFIPVGYEPPKVAVKDDTPLLTPAMFKLSTTILGSPSVAVINGKDHAEKEWFETEVNGQKIQIYLLQVSDGAIVLYHPKVGNIPVSTR